MLLDERYLERRMQENMSRWIRPVIAAHTQFGEALSSLQAFFARNVEETKPKPEEVCFFVFFFFSLLNLTSCIQARRGRGPAQAALVLWKMLSSRVVGCFSAAARLDQEQDAAASQTAVGKRFCRLGQNLVF